MSHNSKGSSVLISSASIRFLSVTLEIVSEAVQSKTSSSISV